MLEKKIKEEINLMEEYLNFVCKEKNKSIGFSIFYGGLCLSSLFYTIYNLNRLNSIQIVSLSSISIYSFYKSIKEIKEARERGKLIEKIQKFIQKKIDDQ